MNKLIHEWINTALIVAVGVLVLVGGNQSGQSFGNTGTRFPNGVSIGTTTSPVGAVGAGNLNVGGETFLDGTSTLAKSFDGFVVGGVFGSISTTSKVVLYTHSGGPAYCNADTGILYFNGAGVFAPGLTVGVGTSTGSVPTNSLISTSTNVANVATSTSGSDSIAVPSPVTKFRLNAGDSIVGMIGDANNVTSSSTYYSNWKGEFKIDCWLSNI